MQRSDLTIPWPVIFTWLVLRDSVSRFQRHRCTTAAAAIAFHVLFSIFPLVLLITAILGTQMRSAEVRKQISDGLLNVLPLDPSASAQIDHLLISATNNLATVGIVGAVGLIWSASGMLGSVRGAMELAWEGTAGTRPFFRGKLVDALLLGIVVSVVLSSFLAGLVLSVVPQVSIDVIRPDSWTGDFAAVVRSSLAPAVSVLTSGVILTLAYKFLPRPRPALRYAIAGATLAAVLLELARRVFSIYVDHVATYDVVYGSIGSIIVFLFFVYIAAIVSLFGAEVGASVRRVHNAGRVLRPEA
ncbi:MAG: YihY/virulence factor BrkB family protein [Thermoleophilia bacterium]